MAYAIRWLGEWSGQDPGTLLADLPGDAGELAPYRRLLAGDQRPTAPGAPLLSIFSWVRDPNSQVEVPQLYWRPRGLSLDEVPRPVDKAQAGQAEERMALWAGFQEEAAQVLRLPTDADARFETFTHLLHKWAWAVPCSYGEPGVSLYDEFRALSALVHASGCAATPAGEFLLVGGDIPGIQEFVYTITSKGAAKGLRGRSFFLQLLGDAVVRRLLVELGLPETNVVYAAGGNFMLLGPAEAESQIEEIGAAINRQLLAAFEGDLSLCLACYPLPAAQVGSAGFAEASRQLHRQLGRQKHRRFADLAGENWEMVFAPKGQGGVQFCGVCQHERRADEEGHTLDDGGWKCNRCHGFEELAQAIARDSLFMLVSDRRPGSRGKGWQELLWQLTGRWYDFPDLKREMAAGSRVYSVNYLDFLGENAQGFRLIANTTPRDDKGQVQTFEELADAATGLKRVGVLRMDVDDLGRVLTQWLPERTMASTSALSHALDRFFNGWLDAICREVGADPQMAGVPGNRGDLLYVIYAGGDDLFVVGAWDLIPLLAGRIQQRFATYVGDNPFLHISAGITLEDRKFPLYRAAERAGEAEGKAKGHIRPDGRRKDAICFLDTVVGWEDWEFVRQQKEDILWLIGEDAENKARKEEERERRLPRALLQVVQSLHQLYRTGLRDARRRIRWENRRRPPDKKLPLPNPQIFFGRWAWMQAYSLTRMAQRSKNEEVKKRLMGLQKALMQPDTVRYSGLAARWAEYLTRGSERQEKRSEG